MMAEELQLIDGTLELACCQTLVVIQIGLGITFLTLCFSRVAPP